MFELELIFVPVAVVVIAQNVRGQYFSSLGTAGIGPDTIDERTRPLAHRQQYSAIIILKIVPCYSQVFTLGYIILAKYVAYGKVTQG